jgi:hypothetical protein
MKGMLAVLGVSVLALGVFALPAAANRIPSNLTINFDPDDDAISGKLKSPKSKCKGNRKVTIMRRIPGDTGFHEFDDDKTNPAGRYETNKYVDLGYGFKAVVKPVTRRGDTCKGAASKVIMSLP